MPTFPCPSCGTPLPADASFCAFCGKPTGERPGPEPASSAAGSNESVMTRLSRALGPKYLVRRSIGRGGFAEVFEVWDEELQRRLAVKVLHPDIAWTAGMLARFRQEARTLAQLAHPAILPIHFVGDAEGLVYYAMPFVDGETLSEVLRARPTLDLSRTLTIIRPILQALDYAHGRGLVHRDIKPDNIMIERGTGRVLLVDFGIAKRVTQEGPGLTQGGFTLGTPHYMSPEQALGDARLDHRSDLYAVGALLYQMVTGSPPFEGASSQEIVGKHLAEPVERPSGRNAQIPAWLSEVILRCLAKKPADRYQSAGRVLEALEEGERGGAPGEISADSLERRMKTARVDPEAATAVVRSQERPVSRTVEATAPAPAARHRWVWLLVPLLLVGVVFLRGRGARLVIENRLVEPVRVLVDSAEVVVPAGATVRHPVPRGRALFVQWYLVQPVGPADARLGEPVQGVLRVEKPRGRIPLPLTSRTASGDWFAPLITNNTGVPLRVIVNAGLQGAMECPCQVPSGTDHVRLGYYRLYGNSTVRVVAPDGRSATFRDLGPEITAASGAIGLRFEPADLK
ncbi:MAG: protein kinase [Gemmatimonadales bacterium]